MKKLVLTINVVKLFLQLLFVIFTIAVCYFKHCAVKLRTVM